MNSGKKLETLFMESCDSQNIDYYRLRDAGYRGEETERRFSVTNICDFIAHSSLTTAYLELKSTNTSLSFSGVREGQAKGLYNKKMSSKDKGLFNIICGFIVELKKYNKIYFLDAEIFYFEYQSRDIPGCSKSISRKFFQENGVILNMYLPPRKRKERINLRKIIRI